MSINIVIDPYNIIHSENNIRIKELESIISNRINYPLYNIPKYLENPTEIILLGDSRTAALRSELFEYQNLRCTNLAYGGGTLPEIIETFNSISNSPGLKEVYIGINFNLYNDYNSMDRVSEASELMNSPISYIFSKYCIKSTFYILYSLCTGDIINIEKPPFNKDEFWDYQLASSADNFYRSYQYPQHSYDSLKNIVQQCKDRAIRLIFFIPPTHADLQDQVSVYNLEREQIKFKTDLRDLGLVYDFDQPNERTENRMNFNDPFHSNDSIGEIIVKEMIIER
jgi:hypothetical protein